MLRFLDRAPRRRTRNRKFTPADPRQERGGSLEGRSLTVPAFWMQGPGSLIPNLANANVNGIATDANLFILDNVNQAATPGLNGAAAAPSQPLEASVPGNEVTMTCLATTTIDDDPNPGNGAGPGNIGNYVVSANSQVTIQWGSISTPGSPPIWASLTGTTNWSRAYTLADDQIGLPGTQVTYANPPVYMHETFDVVCTSPDGGAVGAAGLNTGPTLVSGVPNGGLNVGVAVWGAAGLAAPAVRLANVTVPLTVNPITGNSGTGFLALPNGSAVSVTFSPTSVHVSTSMPIASLPTTTFTGPVLGPDWYATGAETLQIARFFSDQTPNGVGQTSLTTTYHASFSNFPTTT